MKKLFLFFLLGLLMLNTACAQKYFGKSYERTQNVDEYYDNVDVKKSFTVMGQAEIDQGFRSLEKCQSKIIDLAKKKGADGVIFAIDEEIYGTSTSSGGSIKNKDRSKTTSTSSSASVDLKKKVIKAKFIKYE